MFIYDQHRENDGPWASVLVVSENELDMLKSNLYLLDYDTDEAVSLGDAAQNLRDFDYDIEAMNTDEIIAALDEEEIARTMDRWFAGRKPDFEGEYVIAGKKCFVYAFVGEK